MPGAVRLRDKATAVDSHGRKRCSHVVTGFAATITQGSKNVFTNGRPSVRMADKGMHRKCCGPNRFTQVQGSMNVYVNGRNFVRLGDKTLHCGGKGKMVQASMNVFVN